MYLRISIVLVGLLLTAPGQRVRCNSFEEFVHHDLRNLDPSSMGRLHRLLLKCLPSKFRPTKKLQSLYLWRTYSSSRAPGFLFFQARPLYELPGQSFAVIHIMDSRARLHRTFEIATGWRLHLDSATLHADPLLQGYVLEIRTSPSYN